MTIYTFWSGDTTYFTKSKSLKKAQEIGKENHRHYLETCKYLHEKPEATTKDYFIPEKVEKISLEFALWAIENDRDIFVLENETSDFLKSRYRKECDK